VDRTAPVEGEETGKEVDKENYHERRHYQEKEGLYHLASIGGMEPSAPCTSHGVAAWFYSPIERGAHYSMMGGGRYTRGGHSPVSLKVIRALRA
jgi:hypothetical protein